MTGDRQRRKVERESEPESESEREGTHHGAGKAHGAKRWALEGKRKPDPASPSPTPFLGATPAPGLRGRRENRAEERAFRGLLRTTSLHSLVRLRRGRQGKWITQLKSSSDPDLLPPGGREEEHPPRGRLRLSRSVPSRFV